jgi:hypothetical protein
VVKNFFNMYQSSFFIGTKIQGRNWEIEELGNFGID